MAGGVVVYAWNTVFEYGKGILTRNNLQYLGVSVIAYCVACTHNYVVVGSDGRRVEIHPHAGFGFIALLCLFVVRSLFVT
jgi:hypothetical protein